VGCCEHKPGDSDITFDVVGNESCNRLLGNAPSAHMETVQKWTQSSYSVDSREVKRLYTVLTKDASVLC